MARPQQVSDDEIREAARGCLFEEGPSVSLATIASRLGISAAALSQRIGSKEALLVAALRPESAPSGFADLRAGPKAGEGVREQLAALLRRTLAFFGNVAPSLVMLRASGLSLERATAPDELAPSLAFRRALAGWLRGAQALGEVGEVDVDAAADALVGAIESRCFLRFIGGPRFVDSDDESFVTGLVQALWTGLARRE